MCDEWMPPLAFPVTLEQFHQLPRNPAYKYEYLGGQAHLTPRPKHYHALLHLGPIEAPEVLPVRPLQPSDWERMDVVFAAAFRSTQPFGSLPDATRLQAARQCLERSRTGGDGPLVEQACFVATDEGLLRGAILITLLPGGDPCDWDSYAWREPPPADAVARRLGRPHITWVFVSPMETGEGVGTSLLASAVRALLDLGYAEMATTFLAGNDSSLLWHWRNGFRLLAHPGSKRDMKQRWERAG